MLIRILHEDHDLTGQNFIVPCAAGVATMSEERFLLIPIHRDREIGNIEHTREQKGDTAYHVRSIGSHKDRNVLAVEICLYHYRHMSSSQSVHRI